MAPQPTVAEIVGGGDRRKSLEALRAILADELDPTEHKPDCECECGAPARDAREVAVLTKELRATLAEIDALPQRGKESTVDEVAQKRADRRAQAAAAPGNPVRNKRGS